MDLEKRSNRSKLNFNIASSFANFLVARKDPKCLFSHCEKRHFVPSGTISMWDATTAHNIMFFSLSIFLSLLYLRYLPLPCLRAPTKNMTIWRAPPPHPKSYQNMMRPWAASAKNISADSLGQCALIQRNGQIKSTGIHLKNIPFVPVRAGQRHTE